MLNEAIAEYLHRHGFDRLSLTRSRLPSKGIVDWASYLRARRFHVLTFDEALAIHERRTGRARRRMAFDVL